MNSSTFSKELWVAKVQIELESKLGIYPRIHISNLIDEETFESMIKGMRIYLNKYGWYNYYIFSKYIQHKFNLSDDKEYVDVIDVYKALGIPIIISDMNEDIANVIISTENIKTVIINSDIIEDKLLKKLVLSHSLYQLSFSHCKAFSYYTKDHFVVTSYPDTSLTDELLIFPTSITTIPIHKKGLFLQRVVLCSTRILPYFIAASYLDCTEHDLDILRSEIPVY